MPLAVQQFEDFDLALSQLGKEIGRDVGRRVVGQPIATHLQPYSDDKLAEFEERLEMLPAPEVAEAICFAATRPRGVDVVTLRIEPLVQKIA